MNTTIFYLTVIVFALAGMFFLWVFGFRRLLLNNFRDSLFVTRDRLYLLAQTGKLDPDSDAYRKVEHLLNGLIRFAHRFTFAFLILAQYQKQKISASTRSDATDQLFGAIDTVDDASVRQELNAITVEAGFLLAFYISRSSVLFLMLAGIGRVVKLAAESKKAVVRLFENEAIEAYAAERGYGSQMAA